MDTTSHEFQEALRDHAKSLGVDPDTETYLLPLVQEALLAELPSDWEQGETEDGTLYYFNSTTEESIWEHPLDAHYRELIQAKKEEHTKTISDVVDTASEKAHVAIISTNDANVYSFDEISDEELSPAPASTKSRISDLFTTSTVSTSIVQTRTSKSRKSLLDTEPTRTERPQPTPVASTTFGFGRDRSWLLDNDDDVTFMAPKAAAQHPLQRQDAAMNLATAHLGSLSSQRPGDAATSALSHSFATEASTLSSSQTKDSQFGSTASAFKDPLFHDTPTPATISAPSSAKIQQLEKTLSDACADLECERAAHSATSRQLQTAQQEAKESGYLKMKINELKAKLSTQESAAAARDKQQVDALAKLEKATAEREKEQLAKVVDLEAENARLVQQQGQTQSQRMETQQKEAQASRQALESKQAEVELLQKRLVEQELESKAALNTFANLNSELQQNLEQQMQSAKAAGQQHVSEAAALRQQLEELDQQYRLLKATAEEQTTKCEQFEKLQQEVCSLKRAAEDYASMCKQLERLEEKCHILESTANEQAEKCEQLGTVENALTKQEKRNREMEETNRDLLAQVERVQREQADLSRKYNALVQDVEVRKTEVGTLQATLRRTQDELWRTQEDLGKANDELRVVSSTMEQQRQLALDRERITADAESQARSCVQRLQSQLTAQLDEQSAAKAKLQSEVLAIRAQLADVQAKEVKPLEKLRGQLQREVDRLTEHIAIMEKEERSTKQELSMQTDRVNHMEIEVDVLVRREQQRKAQIDALSSAKTTVEKQLATLQDELLTAEHDKRVDTDKLNTRIRELESQVTQKEYEVARLEERFTKAEAWRVKETVRVEKRDAQLMDLREQLAALQARHVELETSSELQELRALKQSAELKTQKLERELSDERDARKREEIRRTEELQRMQQAVEWQLPQLAQACVSRSSDEWARKCRAVAKKVRDELSMRALQERNELVAREHQAHAMCERVEQKLKTAVAESEFLRREVGRLEDNNKVLLEQLHTIRVYLTQRSLPSQLGGVGSPPWLWPGGSSPSTSIPTHPTAASSVGGTSVPLNFNEFSTVNHLNTQLGILHAQFQQLFDSNERRRAPTASLSSSNRFEMPKSPTASTSVAMETSEQDSCSKGEAKMKRKEDKDAEIQQLAIDALMDQKLASCNYSNVHTSSSVCSLQRQEDELLTTLESLGQASNPQWLQVYAPGTSPFVNTEEDDGDDLHAPNSTLWYQQDYWRHKYR